MCHPLTILILPLFSEENTICTKNFFKKADCNSLLEYKSSHHKKWLTNISFGQFRRIRQNCTKKKDFTEQSRILTKRLKEKGYPKSIIKGAQERAGGMSVYYRKIRRQVTKKREISNTHLSPLSIKTIVL